MMKGMVSPPFRRARPHRERFEPVTVRSWITVWSVLPGLHSFTGEDVAEFHLHGGCAVVSAVYQSSVRSTVCARQWPANSAARFRNGKVDLLEIEGLADLISAETEMQRRLALEYSSGISDALLAILVAAFTRVARSLKLELDLTKTMFRLVSDQVWSDTTALVSEAMSASRLAKAGEIIRDGFKVVIAGLPNAGKSSLMNALICRDIAIVTDIAGTTRDVLSNDLDIDGFLVKLTIPPACGRPKRLLSARAFVGAHGNGSRRSRDLH